MNIFNKNVKISATIIIIILILISTLIVGILFFKDTVNSKVGVILGSLFAGLIVALIQFIIAWQDYEQTEKLKDLELIQVLYDRADRKFYEYIIKKSRRKISMMGVTGSRFFNDFADNSPDATSNARVLLDALQRNVKVQIMLPEAEYIDEIKRHDVAAVKKVVKEINDKYPDIFEVRYFKHIPAHSIFCIDEKCIVGPVFPKLESKYTPALYLRNSSPIAVQYLNYFDNEWERNSE